MPSTLQKSLTNAGDPVTAYDPVVKTLHWTVLLLLIVQYLTKLIPPDALPGVGERALNAWHLAVGPSILVLMLIRLLWRLTHKVPEPPSDLPLALQLFSRATHWALYGLLILLPVLGWLAASGYGATAYLFGLIKLPALVGKNEGFAEMIGGVHGTVAWLLLAVIALHVSGALYHALIKQDGVIRRMLPARNAG